MVSEAVATSAPVLLAELPGSSRRIDAFHRALLDEGRVRRFAGRLRGLAGRAAGRYTGAGAEMRRRLGL